MKKTRVARAQGSAPRRDRQQDGKDAKGFEPFHDGGRLFCLLHLTLFHLQGRRHLHLLVFMTRASTGQTSVISSGEEGIRAMKNARAIRRFREGG